jgi:hypothetical protein
MGKKPASADKGRTNTSRYDPPSLLVLTCIVVVGLLLGWAISDAMPGNGRDVHAFRSDPWYLTWSALGATNCAVWLVLGYFGSRLLRNQLSAASGASEWQGRLAGPIFAYLSLGLVVTVLSDVTTVRSSRIGVPFPLEHSVLRLTAFTAIGVVGSLPSGAGLWWILSQARNLGRALEHAVPVDPVVLDTFVRYQESAQLFLGMLATSVAAAVAQTSALRQTLLGSKIMQPADYPSEFVLTYGALFALAVAFVYLPTALVLRQTGRLIRDTAARHLLAAKTDQPTHDIGRWLDLQDCRARLDTALGLHLSVTARIQVALGLLAPLLASLVGASLPGSK